MVVDGDTLDEDNETFFLNLSNASNASLSDAQGLGTITDDDPLPSVAIGDVTVTEGDTGTVTASFNVTLAPASGREVSVQYATANGTATAPADYSATSGGLTFAAGETTKQVTVPVQSDTLDEIDENFTVGLANADGATITDDQGFGTITDNDPLPALSVNDVTVTEGDAGTVDATFTVTLAPVSGRLVTVHYATANGSATTPADYTATSGTLTFAAGDTSETITVTVNGDVLDEGNEQFVVNLSSPSNAGFGDLVGVATINDQDPPPALSISDATITEGDAGTVDATFTVTLAPVSGQTVFVQYATANGSATAGADYGAIGLTTLTFLPGETTKTITVSVNADLLDEDDETFTVGLSSPVSATLADATGIGTITDNDPLSALSVNDVARVEGNAGTVAATFTVTLAPATGRTVTVDYATANGSASSASDYGAASGTLTFVPGQTTKTVTVLVNGDLTLEGDKTFFLNLTNAPKATLAEPQGTGTIIDDDGQPALSIDDVTVNEGNSGAVNAAFTVTLSPASGQIVTVSIDERRQCDGSGGLQRRKRHPRLQPRPDDEDAQRSGQRRPARRDRREFHGHALRAGQRDNRRRSRPGDDHGQRRPACALDQRCRDHRRRLGDDDHDVHGQPERAERKAGLRQLRN